MRIRVIWLMGVLVLVAVAGGACKRTGRFESLAALDRAYQAGILTKEEYAAKRSALLANGEKSSALDKAFQSGVITRGEYEAKRSQLAGTAEQSAPVTPVAANATPERETAVPSDQSLTKIDNPGGGQILYGPVGGQSTLPGAMGAILRNVHGRFGDRPEVDRFFQPKGSNSVATFFTLTAKTEDGRRIAGMAIVSMLANAQPGAAVLYDDADRFGKTARVMLKKLDEVWHPGAASLVPAGQTRPTPARPAGLPPLHPVAFSDGSGRIGLPEGWHIVWSGAGAVRADGPNGERVVMAAIWSAYDPTTREGQGLLQFVTKGGTPLPNNTGVAPYTGDLGRDWFALLQYFSQRNHQPIPTLQVTGSPNSAQGGPGHVVFYADLDYHDGKGPLASKIQIDGMSRSPAMWALIFFQLSAPKRLADEEGATLQAIAKTLNQDAGVIQRETQVQRDKTGEIARANIAVANAIKASGEQLNRTIEANREQQDQQNQAFSNYIRDQTVVQNTTNGAQGTLSYGSANALVTAFPNQFQYVGDPSQFLKGIVY